MTIKLSKKAALMGKGFKAPETRDTDTDLPSNYFDKWVRYMIADLNRAGVRMMAVPEVNRKRAFVLEEQFTEAANRNDQETFLKLLKEWRQCFH